MGCARRVRVSLRARNFEIGSGSTSAAIELPSRWPPAPPWRRSCECGWFFTVQWLPCSWRCSRRGCRWQQWCLAQCCRGAELNPDGMATSCELGVHQRRRLALLQLDLRLALTRCAHCVRLVGSSRTQLPQLVTMGPAGHVASSTIHRQHAARVGPCATCVQSAGTAACTPKSQTTYKFCLPPKPVVLYCTHRYMYHVPKHVGC